MQGQEENGLLKPPTSVESTDLPAEGLAQMKILTMDEADMLRATRAFINNHEFTDIEIDTICCVKKVCFELTELIVKSCPASRQRSQALGNIEQVLMWVEGSLKNQ